MQYAKTGRGRPARNTQRHGEGQAPPLSSRAAPLPSLHAVDSSRICSRSALSSGEPPSVPACAIPRRTGSTRPDGGWLLVVHGPAAPIAEL